METDVRNEYTLRDLMEDEDLIFVYAWADWNLYCRHLNRTYKVSCRESLDLPY